MIAKMSQSHVVPQPFSLAVVVIGRNEGVRLRTCISSALTNDVPAVVVYVDSGSSDGSVALAQAFGCSVVNLDLRTPFTAARARNEGFLYALQLKPDLTHVQFVDGDCELASGWLHAAITFLQTNPGVAAACGRRRERYPLRSIYNQLCDVEWDTPVGPTKSCGGDVLVRVSAFQQVGGYRNSLIAGEEPELCVRLRAAGWSIWRLDHEMTLHDAAILRFGQWWRRCMRAGHAYAEGAVLHGAPPERHWVRESRSAWLWGAALPLVIAILTVAVSPWALGLLVVYPLQVVRLWRRAHIAVSIPGWHAAFLVLGKFPEMMGQLKFVMGRLRGRSSRLIEYK
jgi:GT2 family glycosyltransferase